MNALMSDEPVLSYSSLPWRIAYCSTPHRDRAIILDSQGAHVASFWATTKQARELIDGNTRLIVATVNACFAVGPESPMSAARAYPKLVAAVHDFLEYGNNPNMPIGELRARMQNALISREGGQYGR